MPRKLLSGFASQLVFSKGSRLLSGGGKGVCGGEGFGGGQRVPRGICSMP